jgi:hypothetical protein
MKAYGGVDVEIHLFLSSAVGGGEWSASRPGSLTPGERAPDNFWIGGRVGPRLGLEDLNRTKNLAPAGTRTPTSWPSSLQPVAIPTELYIWTESV